MEKHTDISFSKFLWSSVAGGWAGISVDFVLFPIDSIKTRIQASTKERNYTKEASKVNKFRGFVSSMLASFPWAAIFWSSYEISKLSLAKNNWASDNLSLPVQHFLAASVAESWQAIVRNPFEVIKQNQQIGKYNTIIEATSSIWEHKGISGFYRGYFSLVSREIPFSGLQFPLYEWFKRLQIKFLAKRQGIQENEVKLNFWNNALNGWLAGSISGYIVTPIDVIKTRRMTHDLNSKAISSREIFVKILKEDGIPGLYRGATMRLIYLSFGGCAFFGIYEAIKKKMESVVYE